MSQTQKIISEIRSDLSAIINTLGPGCLIPSRFISLASTDCHRAFHNLGLCLKVAGGDNPYPESTNPQSKEIEKAKDVTDMWIRLEGKTQLERVKELRLYIDSLLKRYDEVSVPAAPRSFLHESIKWLTEVKMWLGWELGRIRIQREVDENSEGQDATSPGLDIKLY